MTFVDVLQITGELTLGPLHTSRLAPCPTTTTGTGTEASRPVRPNWNLSRTPTQWVTSTTRRLSTTHPTPTSTSTSSAPRIANHPAPPLSKVCLHSLFRRSPEYEVNLVLWCRQYYLGKINLYVDVVSNLEIFFVSCWYFPCHCDIVAEWCSFHWIFLLEKKTVSRFRLRLQSLYTGPATPLNTEAQAFYIHRGLTH